MVLMGITVKRWIGKPDSWLVVANNGDAYWEASEDAARRLAEEIEQDAKMHPYVFKVEFTYA